MHVGFHRRGEDAREELTTVVTGCKLYFAGGSCWRTQLGFPTWEGEGEGRSRVFGVR